MYGLTKSIHQHAFLGILGIQLATMSNNGHFGMNQAQAIKLINNNQDMLLQIGQQIQSQVDQKAALTAQSGVQVQAGQQSKAQWGFLKNIVNIDTFFASGPSERSHKSSLQQKSSSSAAALEQVDKAMTSSSKKKTGAKKNSKTLLQTGSAHGKTVKKAAVKKQVEKKVEVEEDEEKVQEEEDNKAEEEAAAAEQAKKEAKEAKKKAKGKKKQAKKIDKANVQEDADLDESEKEMKKQQEQKNKLKKMAEDQAAKVRNEGIKVIVMAHQTQLNNNQEIDLEIEEPGSANEVAEQGSLTMQSEEEFASFTKQLEAARKKSGNQIGNGGQLIALKSPKEFADTMKILVLHDTKTDEKDLKNENFNTIDPTQAQTAAMAMGMTLQTGLGATIVDDGQKGRESII